MTENLKDQIETMPNLTLEPFETEMPTAEGTLSAIEPEKADIAQVDLSPEEEKMIDEFVEKIELSNSSVILQYGVGTQKKMADFSENALSNVRNKDLGEVGDMLTGVVTELKGFEADDEKGFLGFFKKGANKIQSMKSKYSKAETNVNTIVEVLEKHQMQLMKDVAMMDKMYEMNKVYYKELTMYILAGKKKLEDVNSNELPKLMEKAKATGLPEDAQAANDLSAICNRFEKKIHDLELTRMISIQMAPQIRLVQSNDTLMSEKIQSTIVNTIPLWKSQMVLALGVANSTEAAKAQREVTDMTNELLRKNATTLKMATIETAKETERGVVDIETLKETNESLITTLDEVLRIQTEGHEKRKAAEVELNRIEVELKEKLLSMSK